MLRQRNTATSCACFIICISEIGAIKYNYMRLVIILWTSAATMACIGDEVEASYFEFLVIRTKKLLCTPRADANGVNPIISAKLSKTDIIMDIKTKHAS